MAAEALSEASGGSVQIDLCDSMPSVGRKFLLAGKGGLNLTHSEAPAPFLARYGDRREQVAPWLHRLDGAAVRDWAHGLGIETFVGSSGRVFPRDMKAAPLLRAWLHRLRERGVRFHMRHRCVGLEPGEARVRLRMAAPEGVVEMEADAVVLALGGGSWARLGSNGAWLPWLAGCGVGIAALQPANCGFDVDWSEHFRGRYAGEPLKSVALSAQFGETRFHQVGEFVATESGVEGSLIYAASSVLRRSIQAAGQATLHLDLLPARSHAWVRGELARARGPRSLSTHLKSRLGLSGVKAGLLYEVLPGEVLKDPDPLAAAIKALPLRLVRPRPLDEAISTAGGVRFDGLAPNLMLHAAPGVFCAGEMIDWEAPTGGYLLTACLASGRVAGEGAWQWLSGRQAADAQH